LEKDVNDHGPASETGHFRTDHLVKDIGRRAISGGFVTLGAQATKFLLNFVTAAVLARLLGPKDFGLVGMALGVMGLVGVFKEMGLSTATVQRDKITQEQVSNLFWINVAFSGILAIICAVIAPFVAEFYHDPRITSIMLALSTAFLLTGSTVQHQALLIRQMRFQAVAMIDVTSMAIGLTVACTMAWFGAGYWALVAQQLVTASCSLVITWMTSAWRPHLPSRNSGVKPLVHFGAHISLADFIGQIVLNSDSVLVGKFFGAESLGLYTRASVLLVRPMQQVTMPVSSVVIPVLARLQNDPHQYRRTFLRAFETLALILLPFTAMCLVLSRPLVLVILGSKWYAAIPLFSAFTLVAVSGPLVAVCTWIYESQGRGKDQLRNHAIAGSAFILAYFIGLHWGPYGVIVSTAICGLLVRLPIVYYIAGRRGPVSTSDLWGAFLSHLPCWGTVFLTTSLAYKVVENAPPIVQLLFSVPVGLGAGAALFFLFPRPRHSAIFAGSKIKSALKARFATS